MDGFRPSLCCNRGTRPAGWSCPGGAIRLFARHSLDTDRCDAGRWCARHDCALCLGAAAREDPRTNGERGNWAHRGGAGAGQCACDHDHFDGRAGVGRCASTGKKSMGGFHHRDDHSNRLSDGSGFAKRKSQRQLGHCVWCHWIVFRGLGRTISKSFSSARSVVSSERQMAGLGDHDLRAGGLHSAGLDAANTS